jgi:hypothetical protein
MIQDFESSGLIELAAKNYRVIVFDRPGFGYSNRPRNVVWTPAAQAELFAAALSHLGISHAIVLDTRGAPLSQWPWRSNIRSWSKGSFLPRDITIRPYALT